MINNKLSSNIFIRGFYFVLNLSIVSLAIVLVCGLFVLGLNYMMSLRAVLFPYNILLLFVVLFLTKHVHKHKPFTKGLTKRLYEFKNNKLISLPYQLVLVWLSHLAGASVGREGIGVLIGSTISSNSKIGLSLKQKITLGISVGFGVLFHTPVTGIVFALELGCIKGTKFLFAIIYMTFLGTFLSELIFGFEHFSVNVMIPTLSLADIFLIIVCIVIMAFVGRLFVYVLEFLKFFSDTRILFVITLGLLLMGDGRYQSLGTNLIDLAFLGDVLWYDFIFKLLLTTSCVAIGFQGGEVTPLFAIGSTLGCALAVLFGLDIQLVAAIGFCVVFANATGGYIAGGILMMELFNPRVGIFLVLFLYINSKLSGKKTIYRDWFSPFYREIF